MMAPAVLGDSRQLWVGARVMSMKTNTTLQAFLCTVLGAFVAAVGLMIAPQQAGAQTVYKCKMADGSTAFQQQPCEAGQGGAVEVRPNVVDHSGLRIQAARMEAQRGQAMDGAGLIYAGMSAAEVRQRLGDATVVNTDVTAMGIRQQLVYRYPDGSMRLIYTQDGAVTAVQERPGLGGGGNAACFSASEIRSALVSARALDQSPAARDRALRRVDEMRNCRR